MDYVEETMHEDELYHHGILGMHWYKKNGPPYPLKPGKHSASEKKAGWRKSLKKQGKSSERLSDREVDNDNYSSHPDDKYMDSRNFGTSDLERLTQRFNSERAFNSALRDKLASENMLDEARLKSMSRKDRQELFIAMERMETDAAYNRAMKNAVQAQIDLINANNTLYNLQHPKTKWQKAKEATGEVLRDIGKSTAKSVGTQVATYFVGTAINRAIGADVVSIKGAQKALTPKEKRMKDWNDTRKEYDSEYEYLKSKHRLDNARQGIFKDKDDKKDDKKKNDKKDDD